MAINIDDLVGKIENEGKSAAGRVSAEEFNRLVLATKENQGAVHGVSINGSSIFHPDEYGNVNVVITETNYVLGVTTQLVGKTAPYRIALGSSLIMRVGISEKYVDGDQQIPVSTACTLKFYVGNIVVGTLTGYDGQTIDFDFASHLSQGTNLIKVIVDDGHSNVYESLAYEINTISLSIRLNTFNPTEIQTGEWTLAVTLLGSRANIYILIDGEGGMVGSQSQGSTSEYTITRGKSDGAHSLEVYAEYEDDSEIRTESYRSEFIYAVEGSVSTSIGTTLLAGTTTTLYNVLAVNYWVFVPGFTGSKEAIVSILGDRNAVLQSTTQTINFTAGESGMQELGISLYDTGLIGDRKVRIECNGETRDINITIHAAEVTLSEISGYDFALSSAGRSNSDRNYNRWESNGVAVDLTQIDFTAVGSGWLPDKDGNIAMHVKRGKRITIPYQPFATNPAMGNGVDVPGTRRGLTFSIELATRNCVRRDASVVRCLHAGVGFEFKANSMTFASNNESLAADYKEDTHVRIDLVIEGNFTTYEWTDNNGNTQTSDEALMLVYVDGVYQQMKLITTTTNFMQATPQDIEIGSDYCDVDIYCVRAYRSALNPEGLQNNRAYDTPVVADKIAIAKRNDIFDSDMNVSYSKLVAARPELPIMLLQMENLPNSKTAVAVERTTFINPGNENDVSQPLPSFTSTNDELKNQGTSSMNYPMPYRNLDEKLKNLIVNEQSVPGIVLYVGSPAGTKFTYKKDYASSEMANNVILSELYTQMGQGLRNTFPNCLTLAQRNLGADTYRQSLVGFPIFIFQYWNNTYKPIGMFNFINAKGDEKVLGFVGAYTWENARAQCWEIRDNNIFFDFALSEHQWDGSLNDGKGGMTPGVFTYYEARYPSDSPSNKDNDFGQASNGGEIAVANNECADLLRLHNWLVSTNQLLATGRILPSPYTDVYGNTHTYDNADYRLAKFVTECEDYIIVDQWCLYYLWREQFWMIDSGSKNLNLYTMDGTHWGCFARDCDSGVAIDNEGKLKFPPYLEDKDYIVNNEFVYNQGTQPEGDNVANVMNGQNSAIWINIRDGFAARLQQMYVTLYSNAATTGFSYEQAIAKFENHQSQWCEALYNFGMKQYHGGTPYSRWIESALGDKKNQRRYWLYYAFAYRMSKYHANADNNVLSFRAFGNGSDLTIKPYTQLYVSVGFGTRDYNNTKRYRCIDTEAGVVVKNEFKSKQNDTIVYVFNSHLLTDIGDLYRFGDLGSIDLTAASRLRSLRIGSHADKDTLGTNGYLYTNTQLKSLDLRNCVSLESLDLTHCVGFGTATGQNGIFALDLSRQNQLQELYLWGSSITSVTLPQTDTLHTIELGGGLRTINLVNLTSLTAFSIQSVQSVTSVTILNSPIVDSYNIIASVYSLGSNQLQQVNVDNVAWEVNTTALLEYLAGLTKQGKCTLRGTVTINGTNKVTFEAKKLFFEAWGNIDSESNPLHIIYSHRAIDYISVKGLNYMGSEWVGKDYPMQVKPDVAYGNNFTNIEWLITTNNYATINPATGVLRVNAIGTEALAPSAVVTCNVTLEDGTVLTDSFTIGFYDRSAHEGDYVYADGSYSDIYDDTKTVIGICFYVNPNDPTDRRMVAPRTFTETRNWGLTTGSLPGIELADSPDYNVYDTPIRNIGTAGVSYATTENIRTADNSDFRADLPEGTAIDDLHLVTLEEQLMGYPAGTVMPVGRYKTLLLIKHRNRILEDSAVNLVPPAASGTTTELSDLRNKVTDIINERGSAYQQYYYPPASLCYAYEPSVRAGEVLADKFKAHNWYLPASGELARIYWYHSNGYTQGAENAIFADAVANGVAGQFGTGWYWSATETSATFAWGIGFSSGYLSTGSKQNPGSVRAVAAF